MSKIIRNTLLFVLTLIVIGTAYGFLMTKAIKRTSSVTETLESIPNPTKPGATPAEQNLSTLLAANAEPTGMGKCHFDGTYSVTQDSMHPKNGAKCPVYEPRSMALSNVFASCSSFVDPNNEMFISCKNPADPVTKCDAIVSIKYRGDAACEYWVSVQRID